jgi:hypothetical protein
MLINALLQIDYLKHDSFALNIGMLACLVVLMLLTKLLKKKGITYFFCGYTKRMYKYAGLRTGIYAL